MCIEEYEPKKERRGNSISLQNVEFLSSSPIEKSGVVHMRVDITLTHALPSVLYIWLLCYRAKQSQVDV